MLLGRSFKTCDNYRKAEQASLVVYFLRFNILSSLSSTHHIRNIVSDNMLSKATVAAAVVMTSKRAKNGKQNQRHKKL